MAKRVNWQRGEYLLVLGLYLKLPYLNGVVPTHKDVVQIISDKYGISRTVDSIKMRLNNFMSCDPEKLAQGVKGIESGKEYCMPYWNEWHNNPVGLQAEISKILASANHTVVPSLELISICPDSPTWSNFELSVIIHIFRTRIPSDETHPMVVFYSLWFEKPLDETVVLLNHFSKLFHHTFAQDSSSLNRIADDFFSEYVNNKDSYSFAGKLYWEAALEKSLDILPDIDIPNFAETVDTIESEDQVSKLVEELTLQGTSRISIIMEAMRKFPDKNLTLAQWSELVSQYIESFSAPQDDVPSQTHIRVSPSADAIQSEPDNEKQVRGKRSKPRLKMRSITLEGQVIEESNPTQMFVEFIELIGADSVYDMKIPYRGVTLVDTKPTPGYEISSKPVGNGFFVGTNCSTQDKISYMQDIAEYFSMDLQIERYYKAKDD